MAQRRKTLVIQATFKALPILHRGIFCYQVEGERQKRARGGRQVIFLFPALHFFQLKLLQRKELKATLSHVFTMCFKVYRNNTTTDTRFQIMGLYINRGLSCQTQDDQVSALITDANKAKQLSQVKIMYFSSNCKYLHYSLILLRCQKNIFWL